MIEITLTQTQDVIELILTIIGIASVFIKFLPELPDNHWAKPYIKFIGNHVALNRKSPNALSISLNR